jgi:two-component system, LytTR family, sensor kinase
MLIENAIKHNIISARSPLRITITSLNGVITVANNLQEKHVKEPSAYVGLTNIIKRYEFLSDIPVEVRKTDKEFIVNVPLVQVEKLTL